MGMRANLPNEISYEISLFNMEQHIYASSQQDFPVIIGSESETKQSSSKVWMCDYNFYCSTTHKDEFSNKVEMNVRFPNIRGRDDWQLKIMCG